MARHQGRSPGSAILGFMAGSRWPALPERQYAHHDIRRQASGFLHQPVHEPACGRCDCHRHAAGRGHGAAASAVSQAGAEHASRHCGARHSNAARGAGNLYGQLMNRLDLNGRVAVVTGGARGIGYAVAERLLRSGAAVSLWDIDAAKLEDAGAQLAALGAVAACCLDLTDDSAVQAAALETAARFGKIDILINNAGITGGNAPTWELDP